jgi:hypothetical protein
MHALRRCAAVTVHTGAACVTPAQYVAGVAAVGPDVWVALSDDVPSDSRWVVGAAGAAKAPPGEAALWQHCRWKGGQHVEGRVFGAGGRGAE